MSADDVIPFVFEGLPVRGALIHLSRSWRRMLRDHDYDPDAHCAITVDSGERPYRLFADNAMTEADRAQ
ncbi:MAG: Hsp33 family molecular chaperone HslO [Proteobacteria bacterium]|nr:Hsp33 family molecular chaperone HslO [Pseudomonadota bacterium]MCH7834093.1 Hsp33 family molecular chaperone HslO [Pseudomonadota bacterium]